MATTIAVSGASTAGISTCETSSFPLTAEAPAAISVAPTTPPISACDELDGIPKYQVNRFQASPPINPANTTVSVIAPVSTIPVAIVAATFNDRNAPAKFNTADNPTATFGRNAPVAIDVAMAFAVS
ncbi:hypothetical protein GCM10009555_055990 [Acrocarpospora macrocephala]